MKQDPTPSVRTDRVLGHFGLAVLIGLLSLPIFFLTMLVPPWWEVDCQRRQILYWSEVVKVHDRSFAGFDFLLAREKWSRTQTPPNPSSDTYFESKEFSVCWQLLIAEWTIVLVLAGVGYVRLSRRVFPLPAISKPQFTEPLQGPAQAAAKPNSHDD